MLCRFYGFSIKAVMDLTLRQFYIMVTQINKIVKLETGAGETGTNRQTLTGRQAAMVSKQLFTKGAM